MQVLSFFAALWHRRYKIDSVGKRLEVIEHYKANGYEATRKNLVAYCISDVVSRTWQGSGDTRLANYYVESADTQHTYAAPLSKDSLSARLLAWYDDASQRGSVNIEKVSKMLLCIYSAPDITKYTADKYDVEHVISKQKLKAGNVYVSERIPGGTLGNLMYLNPKTNRGKKQFSLYILQENHEGVRFDDGYLEMLSYPSKEAIFKAEDQLSQGDGAAARALIDARAREMFARISKAVCSQ